MSFLLKTVKGGGFKLEIEFDVGEKNQIFFLGGEGYIVTLQLFFSKHETQKPAEKCENLLIFSLQSLISRKARFIFFILILSKEQKKSIVIMNLKIPITGL